MLSKHKNTVRECYSFCCILYTGLYQFISTPIEIIMMVHLVVIACLCANCTAQSLLNRTWITFRRYITNGKFHCIQLTSAILKRGIINEWANTNWEPFVTDFRKRWTQLNDIGNECSTLNFNLIWFQIMIIATDGAAIFRAIL